MSDVRRVLGRFCPCLEPPLCFALPDDVMEHVDGAVKVSEITELLRAEYGIVTGKIVLFQNYFFLPSLSTRHISHCFRHIGHRGFSGGRRPSFPNKYLNIYVQYMCVCVFIKSFLFCVWGGGGRGIRTPRS